MNYRNKTTGVVSTQGEIRQANSNTSFPKVWDADVCTHLNIEPVLDSAKPSHSNLQTVISDGVKLDERGNFTQAWIVVDKFSATTDDDGVVTSKADHEAAFTASELAKVAAAARVIRDGLLAATDFYALSDVSMSEAMTTYRSDLRAVPTLSGFPNDFEWPTAP